MNILDLPDELIQKIMVNVNTENIMSVVFCSKYLYHILSKETFWENYCHFHWGSTFWIEASNRDIQHCKPFISYYHELCRIIKFEADCIKHLQFKPTINDYRFIWKFI